jgi:hypothetical protein
VRRSYGKAATSRAVERANGTLRVHVQATQELAQAPDALSALGTTHTQGKLAIHIQ